MRVLGGVSLPATMSALVSAKGGVALVRQSVPVPRAGQVLVRVRAAPINPNDLLFLDGTYEVKKPDGAVAGFEGSGRVVATGGGLFARYWLGRRVACAAGDGEGTWAEYTCADVRRCAPLDAGVDFEQGSMLLTNPMTAVVLLRTARRAGHAAFVQNAAAGALGKMLLRLCLRARLPMVNVVRRAAQADALRALGAEHVVVASANDADSELRDLCERFAVRFAFDALAGESTGQLARVLPKRSRILVYGMLSGTPCDVDAHDLVFRGITVEGFTMYDWIERTSLLGQLAVLRSVQKGLANELRSEVRARKPLAEHAAALALARDAATGGKVLFVNES